MGNGAGPTQIGSGDLRVPTLRAKIMRWLAPDSLPAGSGREVLDTPNTQSEEPAPVYLEGSLPGSGLVREHAPPPLSSSGLFAELVVELDLDIDRRRCDLGPVRII